MLLLFSINFFSVFCFCFDNLQQKIIKQKAIENRLRPNENGKEQKKIRKNKRREEKEKNTFLEMLGKIAIRPSELHNESLSLVESGVGLSRY